MPAWQKDKAWKQQKLFIIKSIFIGVLLIPGIYLIFKTLRFLFGPVFFYLSVPALIIGFLFIKSIVQERGFFEILFDYITVVSFDYVEQESYFEKRFNATYALIIINIIIHYMVFLAPPNLIIKIFEYFSFFPKKVELWNILLSPVTANFLHAGGEHLWGNMLFLFIFGLILEKRVGWKKFLLIFLVAGIISSIFPVYLSIVTRQQIISSIGASGAIMGVMGAFAVRLFYKRIVFPLPLLGILSALLGLYFKLRMNSLVLITCYFFWDLRFGLMELSSEFVESGIDYWGHISGFLAGLILASRMRLDNEAVEEIMLERALTAIDITGSNQEAEKYFGYVLEINPERIEALVNLARLKKDQKENQKSQELYLKAIDILIARDPEKATELFAEYFLNFRRPLQPEKQLYLADFLVGTGRTDLAARALEILADDENTPESVRPHLLYRAARLLEKLDDCEAACYRYEQLLSKYPDFSDVDKAKFRLERLKSVTQDYSWTSFIYCRRQSGEGGRRE